MIEFGTGEFYEIFEPTGTSEALRSVPFFRSALAFRSSASFAFLASISALRFSDIVYNRYSEQLEETLRGPQ